MNKIPPLNIVLPSRITVPRQNPRTPLSAEMLLQASSVVAPRALCARVLMVSNGCVAYVVTIPAMHPFAKFVATLCSICLACSKSFRLLYVPIRNAVAPACFSVVPVNPRYSARMPCSW